MLSWLFGSSKTDETDLLQAGISKNIIFEILFSCYIVENNIRNYLFQIVDLDTSVRTQQSNLIKKFIQYRFPYLHMFQNDYGIFVTKEKISETDVDSDSKVGHVLGYSPSCANNFTNLDRSKTFYSMTLGVVINGEKVYLLSFICAKRTPNDKYISELRDKMKNISKKVPLPIYKEKPLSIKSFFIEIQEILPTSYYIDKLVSNQKLTQKDKDEMENYLFNIGFNQKVRKDFMHHFQPHNNTHKGIMVTLICLLNNDPLTPFIPISKTGKENEIEHYQNKFGRSLVEQLKHTK